MGAAACATLESAGAASIVTAGPGLERCGLSFVDKAGPSRVGVAAPPEAVQQFCGQAAGPPEAALRLCGEPTAALQLLGRRHAEAARCRLRKELGGISREALLGDLQFGGELGSGSWSTVYRGEWRSRRVAVKAFHRSLVERPEETEQRWQMFLREARLMQGLRNPRVVELLGICIGSDGGPCLLLELGTGGTLHTLLHGGGAGGGSPRRGQREATLLRPAQRFLLASHVTEGVAYLHQQAPPIIHRDLKSHNVVVMRSGRDGQLQGAKLIDLGLAECVPRAGATDEADVGSVVVRASKLPEVRGSASSMAPECLAEAPSGSSRTVGPAADVWALGCVLVEIFGGAPPHAECEDAVQVAAKVLGRREPPDVPPHVDLAAGGAVTDDKVQLLLRSCFAFEADDRPSAGALLEELQELMVARDLKLSLEGGKGRT